MQSLLREILHPDPFDFGQGKQVGTQNDTPWALTSC